MVGRSAHRVCYCLLLVTSAAVCRADDELLLITAENAKENIGKRATVEFVVHATKQSSGDTYCFLNAEKDPTSLKDFTVFIPADTLEKFRLDTELEQPVNYYLYKVQVTGLIEKYRDKPEIVLHSPDQIKVIERPNVIKPEEARNNIGKNVVVEFTVHASNEVAEKKICFLDSETDFNDPKNVGVFITNKGTEGYAAVEKIEHPATYLLNKKIRVTGTLRLYKQKPELIVDSPQRIKVVDEREDIAQ